VVAAPGRRPRVGEAVGITVEREALHRFDDDGARVE
jgi:hypothetical protein